MYVTLVGILTDDTDEPANAISSYERGYSIIIIIIIIIIMIIVIIIIIIIISTNGL